ncbi:Vacuolar fusion protein [Dirofilaria immitis]
MNYYDKIISKQFNTIWRQKTQSIVNIDDQTLYDIKTGYNRLSPRNSIKLKKINQELPDYSYINISQETK